MTEGSSKKTPLTERSSEEKTVVAGGIALLVVAVLFVGWAIIFIKKVQRGSVTPSFESPVQEQFNFNAVRDAQQQLEAGYEAVTNEFRTIRKEGQSGGGAKVQEIEIGGQEEDVFGTSE